MPHRDPIAVPPPEPFPSGRKPRRFRAPRSLPSQASATARARSGGQQGRRKRSARADEVAQGPKRRRLFTIHKAEEGAVVQTPAGQAPVPEREPRHPDADKTGYEAIKEVLGD